MDSIVTEKFYLVSKNIYLTFLKLPFQCEGLPSWSQTFPRHRCCFNSIESVLRFRTTVGQVQLLVCLIWTYIIDSLFYHTHCVPDHCSRFRPFVKERQENWNIDFFLIILILSMIRWPRNVAHYSISSCHHHIFHLFKPTMRKKLLIYKHQSNSLGFKTPQYMPRTFIHRYYTSFLVSIYLIK